MRGGSEGWKENCPADQDYQDRTTTKSRPGKRKDWTLQGALHTGRGPGRAQDRLTKIRVGEGADERGPISLAAEASNEITQVRKTDGTITNSADYKDINAKIADDGFQLPLVEDQMVNLAGSEFFMG